MPLPTSLTPGDPGHLSHHEQLHDRFNGLEALAAGDADDLVALDGSGGFKASKVIPSGDENDLVALDDVGGLKTVASGAYVNVTGASEGDVPAYDDGTWRPVAVVGQSTHLSAAGATAAQGGDVVTEFASVWSLSGGDIHFAPNRNGPGVPVIENYNPEGDQMFSEVGP